MMMKRSEQVWLVTGASSGLGREITQAVLQKGGRVVATARNSGDLDRIVAQSAGNAIALPMDVTVPEQISAAVEAAEDHFGSIDVLVNNAGYGYLHGVEEADEQAVRRMFEVNFFGLANATRAVLPGMRARRRGWIVNISSMVGRVALACSGYYSATKFAVEGLSMALRAEVEPLGIGVTSIQPGPIRTDFAGRSLVTGQTWADDYDATVGTGIRFSRDLDGQQSGNPVLCAGAIVDALDTAAPPHQYVLGQMSYDMITQELEKERAEMAQWKDAGIRTDFTDQ
jgi:NAD(P)-dependent dehydrogenase (short-subunit alcohol dehydrogenase family)